MAPPDDSFRSSPRVVAFGRWIDRIGIGRAVFVLVAITVVISTVLAYWLMQSLPVDNRRPGTWLAAIVSATICAPVSMILCRLLTDVSRSRAALHRLATIDSLTLAHTRRHFMDQAPTLIATTASTAVILLDVDHFKGINDRHGHPAGDAALRAVSAACRDCLVDATLFARYGGEEFIVLAPDTDLAAGTRLAERLRVAIASLAIATPEGQTLAVTASFGVAVRDGRLAPDTALHDAVVEADGALYAAKRRGRDRVCGVDAGVIVETSAGAAAHALPSARAAVRARSDATPDATPDNPLHSPRWLLALEGLVVHHGRLRATLASVAFSTITSVALTFGLMVATGMPGYLIGTGLSLIIAPLCSSWICWFLCSLVADVAQARALLRQIAHFDGLTRAHSRRYFMTAGPALLVRSPTSAIALIDVDDFKGVNDRYGHAVGDEVLKAVSDACRSVLRDGDLFARYGGEEFAAILPGADAADAGPIVERMRQVVAALNLRTPGGEPIRVTASFGLAEQRRRPLPPELADAALETTLGAADRALYAAKRGGKNRVAEDRSPALSTAVAMPA